jgi:hypothetical protein
LLKLSLVRFIALCLLLLTLSLLAPGPFYQGAPKGTLFPVFDTTVLVKHALNEQCFAAARSSVQQS